MSEQPHPSTQAQGAQQAVDRSPSAGGVGTKRAVVAIAGVVLVLDGLRRRSLLGGLMTVAGGWLAYRGIRGRSPSLPTPALGDVLPSGGEQGSAGQAPTDVERSITIDAPAAELHEYWTDADRLSEILGEFVEITEADEDRLHWRVDLPVEQFPLDRVPFERLPVGRSAIPRSYEWETEFVEDESGEVLRWETVEGTRLPSEWELSFSEAPGDRGTEVTLRAEFHPPGGSVGARAMDRLGFAIEPIVGTSLRRFKSLAETGEIPTLAGNPSARGQGDLA